MAKTFKEFSPETDHAWVRKNCPTNLHMIPLVDIKNLSMELKKDFPHLKDEEVKVFCFFGAEFRHPGYAVAIPCTNRPPGYTTVNL